MLSSNDGRYVFLSSDSLDVLSYLGVIAAACCVPTQQYQLSRIQDPAPVAVDAFV